jgi:hypothetical protein
MPGMGEAPSGTAKVGTTVSTAQAVAKKRKPKADKPKPEETSAVQNPNPSTEEVVESQDQLLQNFLEEDKKFHGNFQVLREQAVTNILAWAAHTLAVSKTLKGKYWNDYQAACKGGQPQCSKFIRIANNEAYKDPEFIKTLPNNIEALYVMCGPVKAPLGQKLLEMPTSTTKVDHADFTSKATINPFMSLNEARTIAKKNIPPSHRYVSHPPQTPAPAAKKPETEQPAKQPEFLDLSLPATEVSAELFAELKGRLVVILNLLAEEFPALEGFQWEVAGDKMPQQPKAAQPKAAQPKAAQPKAAQPKTYAVGMKVRHSKYGEGTVTTVKDADTIEIQFADRSLTIKTAVANLEVLNG